MLKYNTTKVLLIDRSFIYLMMLYQQNYYIAYLIEWFVSDVLEKMWKDVMAFISISTFSLQCLISQKI
jgi:hypothetical protein